MQSTPTDALLHSPARNHALLDGDKRLAWTACRTFLAVNGEWSLELPGRTEPGATGKD